MSPSHLAELGSVDVVMVPVDGVWTLNQEEMVEVLQQIKPKLVIPMHIFTDATLDKFLARIGDIYQIRHAASHTVVLTRAELPERAELLVLPGQ